MKKRLTKFTVSVLTAAMVMTSLSVDMLSVRAGQAVETERKNEKTVSGTDIIFRRFHLP